MLKNLIRDRDDSSYFSTEEKRIRLLNQMAIIFLVPICVKLTTEIIALDVIGISIASALAILFTSVLLLNFRKLYFFARLLFLLTNLAVLVGLNLLFGRGFGVEFLMFSLSIVIILFYDKLEWKLFWLFIIACCYIMSRMYLSKHEPILLHNLNNNTYYYMLVINILIIFALFNAFVSENRKFEQETNGLLAELTNKNKELQNANKELERFAFAASHDLKTPLRNINSFLQLIERRMKQGKTEELPEYLEFARLNAQRMSNLVEDILEFSRLDVKNMSFQEVDLNKIIDQVMFNLQDMVEVKKAVVQIPDLPVLLCNETQMISLFQNLIENGIKYNESKNPHITIALKEYPKEYNISVEDNGIGISKEYQDKVFEMFYRLHNQGEYDGSGIGLATSKKIVTYHGGLLSVRSSSEQGTIFCIKLLKHNQQVNQVA